MYFEFSKQSLYRYLIQENINKMNDIKNCFYSFNKKVVKFSMQSSDKKHFSLILNTIQVFDIFVITLSNIRDNQQNQAVYISNSI